MSGEITSESAAPRAVDAADATPTVPLQEFCASVSAHDKRVELIAGFFSDEKRAGRHHDTAEAYQERLEAFAIRPVK